MSTRKRRRPAVEKPALEGTVSLSDGRDLGFASFGDPQASETIFWLHGTPGARRQIPLDAREHAAEAGIRVIGIDRPGVGWSSPHVYGTVFDFSRDLEALADHLGVTFMHVVGLSGGGPYTLAAGAAMPDRVKSLGVIGGVAPTVGPDAIGGGLVAVAKPLAPALKIARLPLGAAMSGFIRVATPLADQAVDLYRFVQPSGDRRILGEPDFKAMFVDDLTNGAKDQFSAFVSDILVFTRHWGFHLEEVQVPVRWWHGDADHIVPYRHGEHVVNRLPDAQLIPLDGEAHLGGLGLATDILGGLVSGRAVIDEVLAADD